VLISSVSAGWTVIVLW